MKPTTFPRKQHGLSLVELMVALLLSSFLIIGVTQIFIDNKRQYFFQQSQTGNQENSRFALMLIEKELLKAGHRRLPQDSFELAFPYQGAANDCPAFSLGQLARPSDSGNGICIRYQRSYNGETDCLGNGIANDAPVTTRIERNANGELICMAQGQSGTLLENLSGLQFEYGVSTNGSRLANQYLTAPAAGASIVSVRYATLMASTADGQSLNKDSYHFPLYATNASTPTDYRLYKSAQGTTTLRNIAQ